MNTRQALFTILVLFLTTRLALFALEHNDYLHRLPNQDDAPGYLQTARVYSGLGTYEQFALTPYSRTPVYPLLLTILFAIFGESMPHLFFVQQTMELIIIITVFLYAKRLYSPTIALITASALLLFFDFTFYGFLVRNEILFSLLILYASSAYIKLFSTNKLYWAIICGILFGLATLTRPVALLIIFPLVIAILYRCIRHKLAWRFAGKAIFLLSFFFAIVIAPWIIRNYKISGRFVIQLETSIIHATFPGGHYQAVNVNKYFNLQDLPATEREDRLFQIALQRIRQHPEIWLKNSLKNFTFRLWSMGFTDTYLRYLGHAPDTGGYQKDPTVSLLSKFISSNNLFNPKISINPIYHAYLIFNNLLGFSMIPLSLLGLILWPYFKLSNKLLFLVVFYFWIITSMFQFSGSRLILPVAPIFFPILPNYYFALKKFTCAMQRH